MSDQENNEYNGILAFDTDSDCNESNQQFQTLLSNLTVIDASSDDELSTTTSKKRKRNVSMWQRNITELKNAQGIEHISLRKKLVPPKVTGLDCLCRKNCFVNVSSEDRITLLTAFNSIGDKCKQDTYLAGLIHVNPVSRRRIRDGSRPNKTCSILYEVRLGVSVTSVCKKAFCSIFCIGKSAVDRIIKKIQNHIPSPTDDRGKHHNRTNKLHASIHFQINTHINSFPKRQSHYSRSDNSIV